MTETLGDWLERQRAFSADALLANVSAQGIVKTRPGFGQTMTVQRGAIVASPVPGAYDPEPDYFFHWFRDSAIVIDALRMLAEDGSVASERASEHFGDFVRFSLSLLDLDGRRLVEVRAWRAHVTAELARFVRPDAELERVHGESVSAETRVNPDGTLDILDWPRPQNDGPALRALAVLRWLGGAPLPEAVAAAATRLLRADLAFVRNRWRQPCFDIWEEERGLNYYTLCVSGAALADGARWLDEQGEAREADAMRREAESVWLLLDEYWLADQRHYRSRVLESGARSTKELDISVVIAAVHARRAGGEHAPQAPRMQETLARLEELFDRTYVINQGRPASRAPAMGRYAGDVYYSGGAYYFSTLAAAELCFRAAAAAVAADARDLAARGDRFLETVRAFTPENGCLSEQFCQSTGAPVSAKHLGWSYAAFISCVAARRALD